MGDTRHGLERRDAERLWNASAGAAQDLFRLATDGMDLQGPDAQDALRGLEEVRRGLAALYRLSHLGIGARYSIRKG